MIKKADLKLRLALIVGLVVWSFFYVFPLEKKINLGLDLKGGMYVLLRADTSGLATDKKANAISAAVEKIRNRIDSFGVKETSIQVQGLNSILVQVPGLVNREMVDKLKQVGKLEFKIVEDDEEKVTSALGGEVPEGYELKKYDDTRLLLKQEAALVGSDLSESFVGFDSYGLAEVRLKFTSEGTKAFAEATEQNVGERLAIVLDGVVKSAPVIREPILSGEAQISGDFSVDEARLIVSVLNSGALPIPLTVEEERSVGPLLGSDSIRRGVSSILLGALLVVVFVVIYYLFGGFITIFCLALDLLFILGGLHLFKGTLTLPGIAGMILTLGMAVDANVLIFERIREELSLHKPLGLAVKNGFNKAKRTIVDANITTLIAAFFLFYYGTGPIKGFATTLSLGIVASIFTSVFVGRTIFSVLLDRRLKKFPMLSLIGSPKINFVKLRGICSIASLIAVFLGMFYFYSNQDKVYGIDFEGGQVLEYKITPPADTEDVRQILKGKGFVDLVIQEFSDIPGGVIIKSKDDIGYELEKTLKDNFDQVDELRVTTIGPTVGKILRQKAYLAILLSLLGILVYIAFRFKHFDFALAAVIALFHDVFITLGILCFVGFKVDLLVVTALLTIAGYSINDTIVIYDRIREIEPRFKRSSLGEVINLAINSTLSRTIITSLTTLMVVVSIYILGGEALKGFSFALLIGIVAGTYSSVYIASPLVLLFRKTRA
ncbi:MAG: protein translocase subunit SecD [Candidatus Omnitrophica bacterium]|nr:protein translocase subunit SecD [Candidatus Omnitrophota bacterium]